MMETLLIIIFATGLGIFHNNNRPTQYALNMEDGTQTQMVVLLFQQKMVAGFMYQIPSPKWEE